MTDMNKVRDEVCDNPEYNIGDTKMDALLLSNRKWGFDQAIAHLSKQSVAFEPSQSWGEMMSYCKSIGISPASEVYGKLRSAFKEQHQRTALIYEAKLIKLSALTEKLFTELNKAHVYVGRPGEHVYDRIHKVLVEYEDYVNEGAK